MLKDSIKNIKIIYKFYIDSYNGLPYIHKKTMRLLIYATFFNMIAGIISVGVTVYNIFYK